MSQQIDPRLYAAAVPPPQGVYHSYDTHKGGLPPVDQSHQLPPLSHDAPLQRSFYRLPHATQDSLQSQTPQYSHSADSIAERYEPQYAAQTSYDNEPGSDTGFNLNQEDQKRARACEACRGLKVRCDRDEDDPDRPCKRCAKARRNCVITAPSRKRQKKTDSRVAELEKKIDALTADLRRHQPGAASTTPEGYARDAIPLSPPHSTTSGPTPGITTPQRNGGVWKRNMEDRTASMAAGSSRDATYEGLNRRSQNNMPDMEAHMAQRPASADSSVTTSSIASTDLPLDRILDQETSNRVFERFVAEMAQYLPAVMFEPSTTAEEIRSKRPVLFLAIMDTASVGMMDLEIQYRLNKMLLDLYAERIIRQGEKSLDLVQALMVSTIWYRPPKRYDQMNVYMLTHISALMALDFGMGRKLNASRSMRVAANVGQSQAPKTFLRSDSVEARRTWLGCYFVCMNVSLSLRRPNFIRWNSYLDECIKVLESAPETLPSDKRLCQHVKLMHINEEVGLRFSMDDPSATIAISDPRVQFAIGAFEKRLDEWSDSVPKHQWDLSLEFSKHYTRLYVHEIALHNNHNIDDFRAPFTEESLKAPSLQAKSLTPYHLGLLRQCLNAVHSMLKTFSAFDIVTLKAVPIYYFVRVAYAVVVLIKLHYAVCDPNNDVQLLEEDLQVELHLDELLQSFHRLAAEDSFRPARMFMIIVTKLRDGFKRSKKSPTGVPSGASAQQLYSMEPTSRPHKTSKSKEKRKGSRSSQASSTSNSTSRRQSEQLQASQLPQQQPFPMQPPNYNAAQTPLQFLSEVATNNSRNIPMSMPYQTHGNHAPWPQHPMSYPQQMMVPGVEYGLDPAFERAVDMTMGIGEGDLSSLFLDDGGYAYQHGLINDERMNHYAAHGAGGW